MKNVRINNFTFLLIGIIVLAMGCKKNWLDVKSNINQTVPSTLQDFESILDDYVTMNQTTPGLAEVGSDGHYMPESRWLTIGNDSEINIQRNVYIWDNSFQNLNVGDWNLSYKKIFQCNLVLDGLKKINSAQEVNKYNRIKGNALFHRAKNEYDLAQIYAEPYQTTTAATDMGIPLKAGVDVTEPAKRSSVKQTYDRILQDLHSAAYLLPTLPEMTTRGSKTAAFALLARTYLTMGDYSNAGLYADSTLRLYNKLIDFNTVNQSAANMGRFNLETIFYAQSVVWSFVFSTNWVFVDPELYMSFENNDLRKTRFFTVNGSGDAIFKGSYNNSVAVFNGLAVDEQYLIRAESYARAGNVTAAMKDLNDLLKTRWNNAVTYPIRSAMDAEDALRQILLERKKELMFRNLRWTDLRRLNLDPRFKTTLTRTIGGNTYVLEPGSHKYTLPIPDDVMNLAPQMKQTPGWE